MLQEDIVEIDIQQLEDGSDIGDRGNSQGHIPLRQRRVNEGMADRKAQSDGGEFAGFTGKIGRDLPDFAYVGDGVGIAVEAGASGDIANIRNEITVAI